MSVLFTDVEGSTVLWERRPCGRSGRLQRSSPSLVSAATGSTAPFGCSGREGYGSRIVQRSWSTAGLGALADPFLGEAVGEIISPNNSVEDTGP